MSLSNRHRIRCRGSSHPPPRLRESPRHDSHALAVFACINVWYGYPFFFTACVLLFYSLLFLVSVYVPPSATCAPRPSILPLQGIPLTQGIQLKPSIPPLIAAKCPTRCGAFGRSQALSRSSQPSIWPFVTAKRPARMRHPAACHSQAFSCL